MKKWVWIFIAISLILLSACQRRQPTDIDLIGEGFHSRYSDISYRSKCEIPRELRGIGKYKINCLVSEKHGAWGESFVSSHSSVFYGLSQIGYRSIGSTNVPGEHLEPDYFQHAIVVMEKPTRTENCFRRIYIDARDLKEAPWFELPKGAQIIIADPWALYCRKDETK